MANWDDIIHNRLTMGRSRPLVYASNKAQRRRENGEEERRPGLMPPAGRGIRPVVVVPRFQHWDGFWGEIITWIIQQEGEVGHSLHPSHLYKSITNFSPIACHAAWHMDLEAMRTPTSLVPLE